VLSIVGESGCGKSVTAMTILGLTRGINAEIGGSVRYQGKELTTASSEELQAIRGDRIAMVFQDPMSSFNPVHKIGDQIVEAILAHRDMDKAEAQRKAVEALGSVGIPDPETRAKHYPFEYSGGMRQRAMIAMALALEPAILIADEPSTALDVTIQAQIIELLRDLNQEHGLSVILITHDLGVVAEIADRVLVMYAGQIVEQGSLDEIFYDPQHPYTWGLLGSIARLDEKRAERLSQIGGQPPSLLAPPPGCRFAPRCPHAFGKCSELPPLGQRLGRAKGHADRCWLDPDDKKKLREVEGRIGLEVPA
jgi:oligopeptide/dipeptide ABC transporter ATP-binding protein